MLRNYKQEKTDQVLLFTGVEIEHTPALGMKTLFVVGIQDSISILDTAKIHNCTHIYCGANMSFIPVMDDMGHYSSNLEAWDDMITALLDDPANLWVTLDFDVKHVEMIHEMCFADSRRFIPQISVKIPYLKLFNYNATLKIDDSDFEYSNPGVWCHKLSDLTPVSKFTDWDQYGKDDIIS